MLIVNSIAPHIFAQIQVLPAIQDAAVSVPNGASHEIMQVLFLLLYGFCLRRSFRFY